MKSLQFIFIILSLFSILVYAIGIDTGMIEWKQPNDVTFIGRAWGDEFRWWMETEDGYRFIQGGGGYYYYAVLDENGEFAASENKVGIDEPLAQSYQLERSASREAEIDSAIAEFEEEIEQNYQEYLQRKWIRIISMPSPFMTPLFNSIPPRRMPKPHWAEYFIPRSNCRRRLPPSSLILTL